MDKNSRTKRFFFLNIQGLNVIEEESDSQRLKIVE